MLPHLTAQIHAIDVYPDPRIGSDQVILGANAPNEGIGRGGVPSGECGDIEIGYKFADIHHIGYAALLKQAAIQDTE